MKSGVGQVLQEKRTRGCLPFYVFLCMYYYFFFSLFSFLFSFILRRAGGWLGTDQQVGPVNLNIHGFGFASCYRI